MLLFAGGTATAHAGARNDAFGSLSLLNTNAGVFTMSSMIKNVVLAGVFGLSLVLVACGKKDEAPNGATGSASLTNAAQKVGSCNKLTNVGKCTEYDQSKDTLGLNKGGCEATEGKWETKACPSEKQFANCATSETKIFYYAGTTAPGSLLTPDEEFAKLDCEMMSGKLTVTGKATAAPAATAAKPATPAAPAKKPVTGPAPAKKK